MTARSIGVVTVGRSDYGIYRPILRELASRRCMDALLFVGGAHLLEKFGSTVDEIERDGFAIAERVPMLDEDGDAPADAASAIGRGVTAFAEAFDRQRPDLLLVLGDRYEMFAAGIAALPLGIPVAHIHGGELTTGLIDDSIRHSLTKLSHLHFVATATYAHRVEQLGEEPWRITVSGAPALDELLRVQPLDDDELANRGVILHGRPLLVTYHPLTLLPERTKADLDALLDAVADTGLDAVLTYPNADPTHTRIVDTIERFASADERYTLVRNLGTDAYATLLRRAAAMIGNSSSGIIEAATFELPVVDIGQRQEGRLRGPNVIHVDGSRSAIAAAISRAVSPEFRSAIAGLHNAYGDGHAAARIVDRLANVPIDENLLIKRFHDLR
jgi:UDP-hydrolysing UDP-N-acetyl-D-glucosamine 2-epimerase